MVVRSACLDLGIERLGRYLSPSNPATSGWIYNAAIATRRLLHSTWLRKNGAFMFI